MDPGGAGQHGGRVLHRRAAPGGGAPGHAAPVPLEPLSGGGGWHRNIRRGRAAAGSDLPISAAMGCAWAEGADKDLQQLLRQADDSMYGTKKKMKERGT